MRKIDIAISFFHRAEKLFKISRTQLIKKRIGI